VRGERGVDVDEQRSGSDDGAAALDANPVQARDVEDDSGRRRVARVAVSAGAGDEVDAVAPRPADRVYDVPDGLAEDDRGRPDPVEARTVETARLFVERARARDDLADEAAPKLTEATRRRSETGRRGGRSHREAAQQELPPVERLHGVEPGYRSR